ncbi:hypothetical protein [Parvularcula sp. IMCC14364]|nr:hypothetical protein [Parvularcula sp. IMCC14364]
MTKQKVTQTGRNSNLAHMIATVLIVVMVAAGYMTAISDLPVTI